jgi:hypothetical protein
MEFKDNKMVAILVPLGLKLSMATNLASADQIFAKNN